MDEGEILSAEQVGTLLDLSESAVWRLLQQGDIPGAKVGGQWRVRRSDLEHVLDLGRAKALAASREKQGQERWGPLLGALEQRYEQSFVVVRCLWCTEWVPADVHHQHTTLCSRECIAELRAAFSLLGWPIDWHLMWSPIHDDLKDIEYWARLSLGNVPIDSIVMGLEPDPEAVETMWAIRHERGPFREVLLVEHPLLRAYLVDGKRPPETRPPRQLFTGEALDALTIKAILEADTAEAILTPPRVIQDFLDFQAARREQGGSRKSRRAGVRDGGDAVADKNVKQADK